MRKLLLIQILLFSVHNLFAQVEKIEAGDAYIYMPEQWKPGDDFLYEITVPLSDGEIINIGPPNVRGLYVTYGPQYVKSEDGKQCVISYRFNSFDEGTFTIPEFRLTQKKSPEYYRVPERQIRITNDCIYTEDMMLRMQKTFAKDKSKDFTNNVFMRWSVPEKDSFHVGDSVLCRLELLSEPRIDGIVSLSGDTFDVTSTSYLSNDTIYYLDDIVYKNKLYNRYILQEYIVISSKKGKLKLPRREAQLMVSLSLHDFEESFICSHTPSFTKYIICNEYSLSVKK